MLNEKKEYELLLTDAYGGLLRRDNLKNDLAGIRPALTVLARGFLDVCDKEGVNSIRDKNTLCCEFLKCWIIGSYNINNAYPEKIVDEFKKAKDCSLYKYISNNKMKIRSLKNSDCETVYNYLSQKIASWDKSMFYSFKENSVNEIYFKAIIADALHKGPLTDKLLVLKNDKANYGIECSEASLRHLNSLLALVGACLQHLPKGQRCSNVKSVQLSNYINKPTFQKNKRGSVFSGVDGFFDEGHFTYKGTPIITKKELTGGVVKFALDTQWLNDAEVKLVNRGEKIGGQYTAFTDNDLLPKRF